MVQMKKIDKFINKKIRDTILLMYRSYSLTQDSSVSFDQLSFILVINTEIFEEVVVSLDRAHFSRVRWTRKGPILGEKSVNGLCHASWTRILHTKYFWVFKGEIFFFCT